ncbi:sulfurtransferase [Marinifilum flexuosum]|uniref:sulfurtransferase n=1 Tax=Marinifilum flexuosum TaxID=1117708 RepID=UPI00249375EB|nr:sulfurtransferase [Marinifilum flexuosum]
MKKIVSAEWLHKNLSNPKLIILDASIETNASGKEFEKFEQTIPLARRFDLKNVFLDKTCPFPNTIPRPQEFESECRKLGINNDSEIVVFDNNGVYSSPRVWWLFNVMGHQKICVLNGGLPNWIKHGFRTEKEHIKTYGVGDFEVKFDKTLIVDFEQMVNNTIDKKFTTVDARSESRFNGTGKEPRKHLKSGKIENSINIPYQDVLQDGKYKSKSELNKLFEEKCKDEKELVFSCGSGISACIVMLACQIGYANSLKVYDGSWTEWAERNNLKTLV